MKKIVPLVLGLILGGCGDSVNSSTTDHAAAFQPRYGIYRNYSAAVLLNNATAAAPTPPPR